MTYEDFSVISSTAFNHPRQLFIWSALNFKYHLHDEAIPIYALNATAHAVRIYS